MFRHLNIFNFDMIYRMILRKDLMHSLYTAHLIPPYAVNQMHNQSDNRFMRILIIE